MQPCAGGVVKQWEVAIHNLLNHTPAKYLVWIYGQPVTAQKITLPPALVQNMCLFYITLQATIHSSILELKNYAKVGAGS